MPKEVRFVDLSMQQREEILERIKKLSEREVEVIELVDGRYYKEVADELDIGYQTVKTHLKSITKKLTIKDQDGYELKLNGKDQLALAWMEYLRKKEASIFTQESGELRVGEEVVASDSIPEEDNGNEDKRSKWIILGIVIIVSLVVLGLVVYPRLDPCYKYRDLTRYHWEAVSATWESKDLLWNKQILITETAPNMSYGKVESEVLTFEVAHCPMFRMHIDMIDENTAITVQILDKNTGQSKDIIKDANHNGMWSANLIQILDWDNSDMQTFTLNIWISGDGDGHSATLDMISFTH